MQTCPDASDGATIVIAAVDQAHRAFVANPTTPLPPVCVFAAFARISGPVPDSLDDQALALTAELRRRGSDQRQVLAAEIVIFARMRRWADVSTSYDRLVALDSQPAVDISKLAIAAAYQRADTAKLVRILARTASQPGAGAARATELNVLRQVGALRSAIAEARGLIRQNPKYLGGYPSLVGNFGTLGQADSVAVYIRRALAQGASRTELTPTLENFVNTALRQATLYGITYGWDARIAGAARVDSALSSPSTKFLLASFMVQSTQASIAEISSAASGNSSPAGAARDQQERVRAAACQRVPALSQRMNVAQAELRAGGDHYAAAAVSQLTAGLAAGESALQTLQAQCAR
jgi:hypothetical protein